MDFIKELEQQVVKDKTAFIAPGAAVYGKVRLSEYTSVWFGAAVRADYDTIYISDHSNIQDNAVIHVDPGAPVKIGRYVTIGHGAIVHGASIGNNTLIGMNATILNYSGIGNNCIIGANALVTENTKIPDNSLVLGSPAKIIKKLSNKQIEAIRENAETYVKLSKKYRGG